MDPSVTDLIAREARFGARNYEPLGVVLSRGEGVFVWDTQGHRYLDCLSAYSAVNQGHCHPKILAAMVEQAGRLTLTSRCWGLAAGLCFFVLYVCGVTLIGVLFGLMRTSSGWIALRLFLVGMPAVLAYGLIGFASEAAGAIYKAAFLVLWAAPIVTLFYYWDPFLRWLAYRG
jgi:hypothetical protein